MRAELKYVFTFDELLPEAQQRAVDTADEKLVLTGTVFAVQCFLRGALNRPIPEMTVRNILNKKDLIKFLHKED